MLFSEFLNSLSVARKKAEMERESLLKGVYDVKISNAISYALTKTLEDLRKKRAFSNF